MSLPDSQSAGGAIRPHHDQCFMCGPGNPAATTQALRRDGDRVVGHVLLDHRHQGVPGLAHGGALAAVVDEVAGTVLLEMGERFVTANLSIDYHSPMPVGRWLSVAAQLEGIDGRKRVVTAELRVDDRLVATARVLFVSVPEEHFSSLGAGPGAQALFGR